MYCSKGTYIRSLAHDFGKALNSGAHLSALCRTRIGNFHLNQAIDIEILKEYIETKDIPHVIFNFVYLPPFRIKFIMIKRKLSNSILIYQKNYYQIVRQ